MMASVYTDNKPYVKIWLYIFILRPYRRVDLKVSKEWMA